MRSVHPAGTSPVGGGKTPAASVVVVGAATVEDVDGADVVGPAPAATSNESRIRSRIGSSCGPVIWTTTTAVNAWFAGLATITWYSAVPNDPHSESMRCDPTKTPSSYGWTASWAHPSGIAKLCTSDSVSVVSGSLGR